MRKISIVFICLVIVFSFVACTNNVEFTETEFTETENNTIVHFNIQKEIILSKPL